MKIREILRVFGKTVKLARPARSTPGFAEPQQSALFAAVDEGERMEMPAPPDEFVIRLANGSYYQASSGLGERARIAGGDAETAARFGSRWAALQVAAQTRGFELAQIIPLAQARREAWTPQNGSGGPQLVQRPAEAAESPGNPLLGASVRGAVCIQPGAHTWWGNNRRIDRSEGEE